jgi:rhodanese-related sulfurtransferase
VSAFGDPEQEIPPQRLAEVLHDEGWQVIDVREPREREAGHLAGTRHVELTQLTAQAESIDRERPVVFYCRVGSRSTMATQAFRAAGYEAYNLTGGIVNWVAAGLPLEPEDGYVAED